MYRSPKTQKHQFLRDLFKNNSNLPDVQKTHHLGLGGNAQLSHPHEDP